jgi:hypothetical protein
MRFQVPQFIGVEDKIFGPLTVKQFIYLAGGAGLIFVLGRFLPFFLSVILGAAVGLLSLALAFYKINDRPFVFVLESAVRYWLASKLYIWKKEEKVPQVSLNSKEILDDPLLYVPKLADSKLKDLNWQLDAKKSNSGVK